VIQAGIVRVVYPAGEVIPDRWREEFMLSASMLAEAGVSLEAV